ncbi:MAG: type II toxin-antitoxin system prevent-host-death family antitoxin [Oscillospiraceae bacterium]|nr:type II toxin-antitoxin system prevent-host-death family antitoxin [Oscillospiraceae bacterium]
MYIKASASIRSNYNDISKLCKETGEPVYLTKNGEGDLVVMDITSFERRAKELRLAENLWEARTARLNGAKGHSIEEVRNMLTKTIEEVGKSK